MRDYIRKTLTDLSESKYKKFSATLTPSVSADKVLGVRVPTLRKMAKQIANNGAIDQFLSDLPHCFLEENNLHAYVIEEYACFERVITLTERFLPYIDNWATCDTFCPKAFKKSPEKLLPYIKKWLKSNHVYTVRFAVNMLMRFFLEDRFKLEYAKSVADLCGEEYYLNMVIAWYFATALAKQYDSVLPLIENKELSVWVHNKTIQKAIESYRISNDKKQHLKSLKIKA